ncbi:MAG: hypothetical protein EXR62_12025 [Chloroflexi bacterium]|nr:hypothetical protein [Chloroflexota bacterium]
MAGHKQLVLSIIGSILLLLVGSGSGLSKANSFGKSTVEKSKIEIIRFDSTGIDIRIQVPEYTGEKLTEADKTYTLVSIPDYELTQVPGKPVLPEKGIMIGIPPDGQPELRIVSVDSHSAWGFHIPPGQAVEVQQDGVPSDFPSFQTHRAEDARIYGSDLDFPAAPVEIAGTGFLRDQRFVKLAIHPIQYLPKNGEIRFNRQMDIHLDFNAKALQAGLQKSRLESQTFREILQSTVLNYAEATNWATKPHPQYDLPANRAPATTPLPANGLSWKIPITQSGIFRLSYNDLHQAGVLAGGPEPRHFKMFKGATEISIAVIGEDDGSFDAGDYVVFYGEGLNTKYTDTNVYWLTIGADDGLRMAAEDGQPAQAPLVPSFQDTVHLEQDTTYWPWLPKKPEHEHWFWKSTLAGPSNSATQSFNFTLPHAASDPFTATVRVDGVGRTTGAHNFQALVNNQAVGQAAWYGGNEQTATFQFPSGFLVAGTNTLKVTAPATGNGTYDEMWYDWIELDYRRTFVADGDTLSFDSAGPDPCSTPHCLQYAITGFSHNQIVLLDVTDPTHPQWVTNGVISGSGPYTLQFQQQTAGLKAFAASSALLSPAETRRDQPSDLHGSTNGADYIIISHSDFITATQPLADYRAGKGERVKVVDLQNVYDEFSGGVKDPAAIHDFLAYAYANWLAPAPSYVLLVGDGSTDPKNHTGHSKPDWVPPYLAPVDPWVYQVASENKFVTVSGADLLPDMLLGRFPVTTITETQVMVNKVLAYEQTPPTGSWNRNTLWVADNMPDAAGNFQASSDKVIATSLPAGFEVQKVYLGTTVPYQNPASQAKAAVINGINAGQLFVSYTGHASYRQWAGEAIFTSTDVGQLANGGKLPVMLSMTCYTGFFQIWIVPPTAIDAELVRKAGGGAIASYGATGQGVGAGHDFLHKGFLGAVFEDGLGHMGQAGLAGKLYLYLNSAGADLDLIDTFVVLGDPALLIGVEKPLYDMDGNGVVDQADIQAIAQRWAQSAGLPYDVDGDGQVTILDVMAVSSEWRN